MTAGRCPHCGSARVYWTRPRILDAIRAWAEEHGRPPRCVDWWSATIAYPSRGTVARMFQGSFALAVKSAGLEPAGKEATRKLICDRMLDYLGEFGRWPSMRDWEAWRPERGRPGTTTVKRHFQLWANAQRAAGRLSLQGQCSGCGCPTGESTRGCRQCQRRDSWRRNAKNAPARVEADEGIKEAA